MPTLYEYGDPIPFPESLKEPETLEKFHSFLDDIWKNRPIYEGSPFARQDDEESERNSTSLQPFINIDYRKKTLRSQNYIGVIHFKGEVYNLMPKVFAPPDSQDSQSDRSDTESDDRQNCMWKHLLWWLSYCRSFKFPNFPTGLSSQKSDILEVLIYLFAQYTRETLSNSIYQFYEEASEELSYIKGRLNTSAYINENISRGRWHKLNCSYDDFRLDNRFNQCIKYVSSLLQNISQDSENKRCLQDIVFILDEVSDRRVSADECRRIRFNPLFSNLAVIRDYCQLFLSYSVISHHMDNLELFAFLLPSEKVFEQFIAGFIEREMSDVCSLSAQNSQRKLDDEGNYELRPDLLLTLTATQKKIIADTKYKSLVPAPNASLKEMGVAQSDIYQMLAYGIRFGIDTIALLYPLPLSASDPHSESETHRDESKTPIITITDEFAKPSKKLHIQAYLLPIINYEVMNKIANLADGNGSEQDRTSEVPAGGWKEMFEPVRQGLKEVIGQVLSDVGLS